MISEGKAKIKLGVPKVVSTHMGVFYNPIMKVNRDISLLIMSSMEKDITVCDILAASGIRLIRAVLELPNVKKVIYNDLDIKAREKFLESLHLNGIDTHKVEIYTEEANILARKLKNVDYLDLDPFGSPVPFLESSLFPVNRYGVLSVTATDTAVLSGTYPQTCFRRYGSKPMLDAEFYHEIGTRILIKKVVEEGAKHDYAFTPIFSYSYKHHMKVFLIKDIGAKRTDKVLESIGYLQYCPSCLYRTSVTLEGIKGTCPYCSSKMHYAGPLWIGKLWDENLVEKIWANRAKVDISQETNKLLSAIKEESKKQTLGFYTISAIGRAYRIANLPPIHKVIELFDGTRTHFRGDGFRSNLPHEEFIEKVKSLRT